MSLKTLKDMNLGSIYVNGGGIDGIKQYLKQEVILWVKIDLEIAKKQESGVDSKMIVGCMKWASRFNITEEDLK